MKNSALHALLFLLLVSKAIFAFSAQAKTTQINIEKKIADAKVLIDSRKDISQGIKILQYYAAKGNDEANYTLGWLFMQDVDSLRHDDDRALRYLRLAGGDRRLSAQILQAAIYASGTETISPDRHKAEELFCDAQVKLEAEFELLRVEKEKERELFSKGDVEDAKASIDTTTKKSLTLYFDSVVLSGISKKSGISLDEVTCQSQ